MIEPVIAVGVFGAVAWAIAQAIFMLVHGDSGVEAVRSTSDTLTDFVEQNYGTHFVPDDPQGEMGLRRI
jgi:hypothetical protein